MKSFNQNFYELFHEIADLMALLGENPFKIRAYREAADSIRQGMPLTAKNTDPKKLREIPGVGEAIAQKIVQYIAEGKIDYLDKLRRSIPKTVRDLLKVPGLGPKRVQSLYLSLGIQSKADLIKAAKDNKIAALPGFGPKLTDQILSAIKLKQEKKKRHPRLEVEPIAIVISKILKKNPGIKTITVAGSFRRGLETVGDLDILAEMQDTGSIPKIILSLEKYFKKIKWLARGTSKISFVIFPQNLQVDIRFVPPESYGAALLYFTGSKDYNVMMRKKALSQDMTLNEYGLFTKTGEYVGGKTEEEVFEKLNMIYRPPEKRQ